MKTVRTILLRILSPLITFATLGSMWLGDTMRVTLREPLHRAWSVWRGSLDPVNRPIQGPVVAGASCIGSSVFHVEGGLRLALGAGKSVGSCIQIPWMGQGY